MKVLGLIPVRGGSKGIPNKNRKLLDGKPLMQYTIENALSSTLLDKVVVSSEDDILIDIANKLGVDVPFKRPKNLSLDSSPTIEVVKHALNYFIEKGETYDAVCLLQVTVPFRPNDQIDSAIDKFIKSNADSLISVRKVPHQYNAHWVFEPNHNGDLKIATGEKSIITRRQDLPVNYYRDGSIYITKSEVILNKDSLYGDQISYIESTHKDFVNIDTIEDWEKAETIVRKNK